MKGMQIENVILESDKSIFRPHETSKLFNFRPFLLSMSKIILEMGRKWQEMMLLMYDLLFNAAARSQATVYDWSKLLPLS